MGSGESKVTHVNIIKRAVVSITALLIAACGTIEDTSWTNGVSRGEALDLHSFLFAHTKAREIYSYLRREDGRIIVSTDAGIWIAHRSGRQWKLVGVVAVS